MLLPRATRNGVIVAIVTAVVAGLLAAAVLVIQFGGHVSGFFRLGTVLPHTPLLPEPDPVIHQGEVGFDGEQFLAIALDPLLRHPETLRAIDGVKYRYRRIGYPVFGWLLGGGNPNRIPVALVATNVMFAGLFAALLAQDRRDSPFIGSVSALIVPGLWIGIFFSTADLVAATFVVAAWRSYEVRRPRLLALAFLFAPLVRETTLVPAVALVMTAWRTRRYADVGRISVATLPALAWNVYVYRLPFPESTAGWRENFGPPFAGLAEKLAWLWGATPTLPTMLECAWFALTLFVFTVALFAPGARSRWPHLWAAAMLYAMILVFARMQMLGYYLNYVRQFIDVFVIVILAARGGPPGVARRVAWVGMAAGSLAFVVGFMIGPP